MTTKLALFYISFIISNIVIRHKNRQKFTLQKNYLWEKSYLHLVVKFFIDFSFKFCKKIMNFK